MYLEKAFLYKTKSTSFEAGGSLFLSLKGTVTQCNISDCRSKQNARVPERPRILLFKRVIKRKDKINHQRKLSEYPFF